MKWPLVLALTLVSGNAWAARYAVIVGNNLGRDTEPRLRFAEPDAQKLAAVLEELGGFEPSRVKLLRSADVAGVEQAFADVASAIAQAGDTEALLVFFYSGHADSASLHLGAGSLELSRLRELLAASRAAVRVGIIDACDVAAMGTREKGLQKQEPFLVVAPAELATRGQVVIAAVSESEAAQESDALGGSFFTTFLVSGLRGPADRSGAGRVSLNDAYRYAYAQTVRATMLSRAGVQHPTFDMDLRGQGDLILTEPRRGRARLLFHADAPGDLAVFSPAQELVATLALERGADAMLALDPGDYEVRKRAPAGMSLARIALQAGDERELRESRMEQLDYLSLPRKGGLRPGIGLEVGWAPWAMTDPSGQVVIRLGLDLSPGPLLISVRVAAGWSGYLASEYESRYLSSPATVNERSASAGVLLAHRWEGARFHGHLGGAVDALLLVQQMFGVTHCAAAGSVAAEAGGGVRVYRGLSIDVALDAGIVVGRASGSLSVWPRTLGTLGVRYEL